MQSSISFAGLQLTFLAEKALWCAELGAMFIADVHFGKAAHFRKSGIPIPEPIHDQDLLQLEKLITTFQPVDFYILGDLFHSDWNDQWQKLNDFLERFPQTTFHLIKGNHDILPHSFYRQSIFQIHDKPLLIHELLLSHEPLEQVPEEKLNICGHIHPGFRIRGKAKQNLFLACFYYKKRQLILPAFGHFTGLAMVKASGDDRIFGISGKKVIQIL
ncbi:ligase-associated DNA damage response endonuclease PdeM [Algoriphagus halophytocola]|uniref:ligase-associated DNA damage response endonuclease PdeM n=1 Tax=Algoriphagus halophytocola TaxID=2991499 RepID=UPI0022DDA0C3|nr:ligase-associated DNA damage response endonuclease PdeM [Algoriphagus sp. TR-M9]WBL44471.1 ligase-associated DNA damage response endonuclease PdeM [Algoriphagus sp. TR-M9]